MTRVVVTLYDHPHNAAKVVDELRNAGFDDLQIDHIEPDPVHQRHTRRNRGTESASEALEVNETIAELTDMGIAEDDALHYADEISMGRSLVAVKAEEEISGRARQIMNRYPLEESKEETTLENEPDRGGSLDITGANNSPETEILSTKNSSNTDEQTDAVEPVESDVLETSQTEQQAREFEAGAHPDDSVLTDTDQQRPSPRRQDATTTQKEAVLGELSGKVAEERFKLYRPQLVRHYQAKYAPYDEYPFEDYARAYRYGMALAASNEFRGQKWPATETEARAQWESHMSAPWSHFREAIQFGWYTIRGEQEKYGSRRPG